MRGLDFIPRIIVSRNRRQAFLLAILGVLFLGGFVLLWYGFLREPALPLIDSQPPPPKPVEIDFSIFEGRVFRGLGTPLTPTPFPEELGKRNPFAPVSPAASPQEEQGEPQE